MQDSDSFKEEGSSEQTEKLESVEERSFETPKDSQISIPTELDDESTTSDTEKLEVEGTTSSSETERWIDPKVYSHPPAEYWHTQKLVKYIKAGNKMATRIALACLKDHDLENEFNRVAIRDIGGCSLLINILETKDYECTCYALDILCAIANHKVICRDITNAGIVPILVRLLQSTSSSIRQKAALLVSIVSQLTRTRSLIYENGGIPLLIHLVDIPPSLLTIPIEKLPPDKIDRIQLCVSTAKALYSLSKSRKVKEEMLKQGILNLLPKLLSSVHEDIVLYTMGFFQNCATEPKCQQAIETEDLIEAILIHLNSQKTELRVLCASAIFKSCDKEGPRRLTYIHNGCDILTGILKEPSTINNTDLLFSITGAIWKCSYYEDTRRRFNDLGLLNILIQLVKHEDEEILVNVVGCLTEFVRIPENQEKLNNSGAIDTLVSFLKYTNNNLLQNVSTILGICACNEKCMKKLEELDAVRYIWSLLKNTDHNVQASAAFALVSCIENAEDSGEMIRSFVGGLELLVRRLKTHNLTVVAAVCAVIAKVAHDKENLAVISDHGVMPLLARHIKKTNILLRQHLASAIAACCWWKNNCHILGQLGICSAIVDYIRTDVEEAKTTAAEALYALSFDPINCIVLHRNGVVPYLLEAISSANKELQLAAAGCLSNIRQLALEADRIKYGGGYQRYKLYEPERQSISVSKSYFNIESEEKCAELLK